MILTQAQADKIKRALGVARNVIDNATQNRVLRAQAVVDVLDEALAEFEPGAGLGPGDSSIRCG